MQVLSTQQVIVALLDANPDARITEDTIRNKLRRGAIVHRPVRFAGRLVWSARSIAELAASLDLEPPTPLTEVGS